MPFKKGSPKPAKSGRKKGVKNKKTLLRAEEFLAENGISPIEKVVELMPYLEPAEQVDAWLDIHKYVEAPKRAGDSAGPVQAPALSPVADPHADPAALLALVKQ